MSPQRKKPKKMDKDYENYDYFSVSVKSAHADEIRECYRALGWSEVKSEDDRDFADMKYILYSRPHDVENRDRLQYLQVRMENALNSISESWVKRYSKSTALAVFLGLFGCALIAVALWAFFALSRESYLWVTILSGSAGICFFIALIYPFFFERKKEEREFKKKSKESFGLLKTLIKEAEVLSGANDKKQSFSFSEGVLKDIGKGSQKDEDGLDETFGGEVENGTDR